jgi:GTP-binding protein HflX
MQRIHTNNEPERVFLFGIQRRSDGKSSWAIEDSLNELTQLARTAGLDVVGASFQKLQKTNPISYIGTGKLEEIGRRMVDEGVQTLIVDDELTPGQQRVVEKCLPEQLKVIDRTTLILDIFAQHASSREGKLQVELAQNQYRLPRLTRMWTHLVRQSGGRSGGVRGGVGLRGPGEMQIETDRRIMRKRISVLKSQLEEVRSHRKRYRQKRRRGGIPVVSLVGYTNAGKSSLLRALSHADVLIEDQLFATLDPTTRRAHLPSGRLALFTDTVGFINKLPHDLVAAFRATLEEITESDLIVHVVDITHPQALNQIEVVENVLLELGVGREKVLTVWNKVDRMNGYPRRDPPAADTEVRISALKGDGLERLLEEIEKRLLSSMQAVEVILPYSEGGLLNRIRRIGSIETQEHRSEGTYIRAHLPADMTKRLSRYRISSK